VRRLRRQPAVLTGVEPEGGGADLLTAGAGHLADVPAAAGRGAVGLHQGDRQLAVVAGLLAGLDQSPEKVAVVGVGVAAGHAPGDGSQGAADLLQRPRRPEVLVAKFGQWNPSAWALVGLLQGDGVRRRRACNGFGELIGQQRQGDVIRRVALAAHVHQLHQSGGLPAGIDVPAARQPHHPRGVLAVGIAAGVGDQLGLQRRPLLGRDGLLQQPVAVGRLAAAEHDQ